MNKKQLNTLSASLSKALSPPSRKKIELSARIIDQVQPLPSIVSPQPSSESAHDAPPQHRGRTPASESNKERIRSEIRSPERLSLTPAGLRSATEQADFTNVPAETFLRQRIVRVQRIQDGLTMAEQRVLNYLWERAERESSTTSRVVTVSQKDVSFVTHLSVVSVRANLRSLQSKLCIEETASFDVTEHLGRTYRVYSFGSILDRWRRSGYLWARQTRGVELLKSANSSVTEESLASEDSQQESLAAQVCLGAQLSSTPQDSSGPLSQHNRHQQVVSANAVSPQDREESSAPQFSLPPQDSSANPKSLDFSRTSRLSKESLPPQVCLAPQDSSSLRRSFTPSNTCTSKQESSAPQDSLPFIKKENKQTKQSSTSSTVSLSQFPQTLQALAEFPASRLADDRIVWNMICQVRINTPDASDSEIADFVHHKAREIKNPRTSFIACLSVAVVGAMQGHRMALYRQQRQKEQEQREAEQRRKLEETVECAEFFVARLEQLLAGKTISVSSQKEAIGFLQVHLSQLPSTLQQRISNALQAFTEQPPAVREGVLRKAGTVSQSSCTPGRLWRLIEVLR